jgi:multimeric flavodoxin WrbA
MKVLAINGSPHMGEGNTALILDPFLEGMKEARAEVELFYTKKLDIKPCNGDMSCWLKHPGECIIKDDMQPLYPKLREAEVIVYATPVYCAGMTGPLKNFMDRQVPIHFPGQEWSKTQEFVLVSTCGAWELDMFTPLLVQMEALGQLGEDNPIEFAGALLRPHAECLKEMLKTEEGRPIAEEALKAAKAAGRQLVEDGTMAEETLKIVSRELMTQEMYNKAAEEFFQQTRESMK